MMFLCLGTLCGERTSQKDVQNDQILGMQWWCLWAISSNHNVPLNMILPTNTQSWQYWHYCQLCVPVHLQFSSLFASTDISKCEIRVQGAYEDYIFFNFRARTKLAMLAFLHCGEIVKISTYVVMIMKSSCVRVAIAEWKLLEIVISRKQAKAAESYGNDEEINRLVATRICARDRYAMKVNVPIVATLLQYVSRIIMGKQASIFTII